MHVQLSCLQIRISLTIGQTNTCGDYHMMNKNIKFDYYPVPTLEELFDYLGEVDVFNTLDPQSRYHQFPLKLEDQVKSIFWGVDEDNKNSLYH